MKTSNHNNTRLLVKNVAKNVSLLVAGIAVLTAAGFSSAQTLEQIRWKDEDKVREILGEPQSTRGPVGTHATYTMWEYPEYTVAFANRKAFHMFRKGSLKKMDLEENRP